MCANFRPFLELLAHLLDSHENRWHNANLQEFAADQLLHGFACFRLELYCATGEKKVHWEQFNDSNQIPCVEHGYRTVILNGWFRNAPLEIRYALYLTWIQLLVRLLTTLDITMLDINAFIGIKP